MKPRYRPKLNTTTAVITAGISQQATTVATTQVSQPTTSKKRSLAHTMTIFEDGTTSSEQSESTHSQTPPLIDGDDQPNVKKSRSDSELKDDGTENVIAGIARLSLN